MATWNVNSVKARLPRLLEWLDEAKPDIVCLQEIKTTTALFPAAEVEELGYEVAAHGEGRWNGVALLSTVGRFEWLPDDPGDPDVAADLDNVLSRSGEADREGFQAVHQADGTPPEFLRGDREQ